MGWCLRSWRCSATSTYRIACDRARRKPILAADFVAKEIEESAREATQVNLHELGLDVYDPARVQTELERLIQEDKGLHTLLQSILAYSFAVYDAGITDSTGRVIVHTNSSLVGTRSSSRGRTTVTVSARLTSSASYRSSTDRPKFTTCTCPSVAAATTSLDIFASASRPCS